MTINSEDEDVNVLGKDDLWFQDGNGDCEKNNSCFQFIYSNGTRVLSNDDDCMDIKDDKKKIMFKKDDKCKVQRTFVARLRACSAHGNCADCYETPFITFNIN